MYYEWFEAHKKKIVIIVIALFIGSVAWAIATAISHIGKIPVTVSPVPSDAQVVINNQSTGGGTQWLTPGTYTFTVKKDGYATDTRKVIVTNDKKQNVTAFSLTPVSDEAKKWADKNQQAYRNNEEFGSIEAQTNGKYFADTHPIVKQLPYNDPYYQINYTQNYSDDSVALTISAPSPRYRYYAVQKICELGFNPTDYRITFEGYENPIKKANQVISDEK